MTNEQDVGGRMIPPHWTQNGAAPQVGAPLPNGNRVSPVDQFLGGSPAAVFMKLLFVSLIVGALMMWLGLRPSDLVNGLVRLIDRIWSLGFDALREVIEYVIAGAAIVVPIWFVLRLMNMRQPSK